MDYCGYVVEVKELRKHPNADRLQLATFFGNETCVDMDTAVGDYGIYFPVGLQLSQEYCDANDLIYNGYIDAKKRNIRAINLRGCKSDGLYLPLYTLEYTKYNLDMLKVGEPITILNGHEICRRYDIPKAEVVVKPKRTNHARKERTKYIEIAPQFKQHVDTEQLRFNLEKIKPGDVIELTLKMHGTSMRTGYLPKKTCKLFGRTYYKYGIVSGTRRTVIEDFGGMHSFRKCYHDFFGRHLWKGETVYYEIVGYTDTGEPIMPSCDNKALKDETFIAKYGEVSNWSYSCNPEGKEMYEVPLANGETYMAYRTSMPVSQCYVYRMTMTTEEGKVLEYSPEQVRERCKEMCVNTVPLLYRGIVPKENKDEWIIETVEKYNGGVDPIGKTHIREGVVLRILNTPYFYAFKDKNFEFKVLSGIIKTDLSNYDEDRLQEI